MKKSLIFSGIPMIQLTLIDKAMTLVHSIDLQYFIMIKNKKILLKSKRDLEKAAVYKSPIVTEITPFKNFYVAEDYHKNYYEKHQDAPYCSFIINPKVHKLTQKYGNDLEDRYK